MTAPAPRQKSLRQAALSGAVILSARGIAVRLIAFAGSVVLARLLSPRDFGVVAVGLVLVAFGQALSDGGVATALIREPGDTHAAVMRAVLGLQLLVAVAVALVVAGFAQLPGLSAGRWVISVMAASLPLSALLTPAKVTLEKQLVWRRLATIETTQAAAYYGVAVAAAAGGLGAMSLAVGVLVRPVAGIVAAWLLVPQSRVLPGWDLSRVRPLLGFGLTVQATSLVSLVRDQGLNLVVGGLGGFRMLGLWSLTQQLLQVPAFVFEGLWRLAYPTLVRMRAAGEDVQRFTRQVLHQLTFVTGLVLVPLIASAHELVPAVFGAKWRGVVPPLQFAFAALLISAPASVVGSGLAYLTEQPRRVLAAVTVDAITGLAVAAALMPSLGVTGVGFGYFLGSILESIVFLRLIRGTVGVPWGNLAKVLVPALVVLAVFVPASRDFEGITKGLVIAVAAAGLFALLALPLNMRSLKAAAGS